MASRLEAEVRRRAQVAGVGRQALARGQGGQGAAVRVEHRAADSRGSQAHRRAGRERGRGRSQGSKGADQGDPRLGVRIRDARARGADAQAHAVGDGRSGCRRGVRPRPEPAEHEHGDDRPDNRRSQGARPRGHADQDRARGVRPAGEMPAVGKVPAGDHGRQAAHGGFHVNAPSATA